jgi:membrane protease YdiL (CAAX protease family)
MLDAAYGMPLSPGSASLRSVATPRRTHPGLKYRKRPFLEPKQLESLRFFLPASTVERRWFAALSITAGFSEELLFRGFLLRYLHTSPLHFPFGWAALTSALIFGAHHLYQGRQGFLSTAILGLVFTAILLVTGSLWAGMVYHAAIDLSILLFWRPKPAATVAP